MLFFSYNILWNNVEIVKMFYNITDLLHFDQTNADLLIIRDFIFKTKS